jgi:hypothetical protein
MFWIPFAFLACFSAGKISLKREITLLKPPVAVSVDIAQHVYVAERGGGVRQYDSTGKQLAYFSPPQVAEITALDARNSLRTFIFYQELQSFTVLNRFLQPIETYKIPSQKIGFAQTIAWSADQNVWVLDSQEASLKKYNPFTEEVIWQASLFQILPKKTKNVEIVRMQEHENRLYLFDSQQIFVLDFLGNGLPALAYNPLSCLQNETLWALVGKELHQVALYQKEQTVLPFPDIPLQARFLEVVNRELWIFLPEKITIWHID